MHAVTNDDRRKELAALLACMRQRPSHDWARERQRVQVLRHMIALAAR